MEHKGRINRKEKIDNVLDEFKVLVNNLVPMSLDQAYWICGEIERLIREHPDLRAKIEEWCRSNDDSRVIEQLTQALTEAKKWKWRRKQ